MSLRSLISDLVASSVWVRRVLGDQGRDIGRHPVRSKDRVAKESCRWLSLAKLWNRVALRQGLAVDQGSHLMTSPVISIQICQIAFWPLSLWPCYQHKAYRYVWTYSSEIQIALRFWPGIWHQLTFVLYHWKTLASFRHAVFHYSFENYRWTKRHLQKCRKRDAAGLAAQHSRNRNCLYRRFPLCRTEVYWSDSCGYGRMNLAPRAKVWICLLHEQFETDLSIVQMFCWEVFAVAARSFAFTPWIRWCLAISFSFDTRSSFAGRPRLVWFWFAIVALFRILGTCLVGSWTSSGSTLFASRGSVCVSIRASPWQSARRFHFDCGRAAATSCAGCPLLFLVRTVCRDESWIFGSWKFEGFSAATAFYSSE